MTDKEDKGVGLGIMGVGLALIGLALLAKGHSVWRIGGLQVAIAVVAMGIGVLARALNASYKYQRQAAGGTGPDWRGALVVIGIVTMVALAANLILFVFLSHDPPRPKIVNVSLIRASRSQTITIKGMNFGTHPPLSGADVPCFRFFDKTAGMGRTWDAGHVNPQDRSFESGAACAASPGTNPDQVTVDLRSWTNDRIVLSGFSGAYGEGYWQLSPKDEVFISVWNAQSGTGPATKPATVTGPSP
ncbi:MAG: hypothetical protein ACREP9_13120 [Candidatus Dormibacteraceae bacterium]